MLFAVVALLAVGGGAAVALLLDGPNGTASMSPTPSPTPFATTSSTATTSPSADPSGTPAATPSPNADPSETPDGDLALLDPWQSVRVTVDGLAVRRGPGTEYSPVSAYLYDEATNTEVLDVEEVRLGDGRYLWVEDGPLVVDGTPWYRVADARQADPDDEPMRWDADGDEFRADAGWVAGGSGSDAYLVPDELPPPAPGDPVFGEGADPYAIAWGTGTGQTDAFEAGAPIGIRWAAAAPDGGSCSIRIMLEPAGVEMASVTVDGWADGDDFWPQEGNAPTGEHRLEVETDCTWSLRVVPIVG